MHGVIVNEGGIGRTRSESVHPAGLRTALLTSDVPHPADRWPSITPIAEPVPIESAKLTTWWRIWLPMLVAILAFGCRLVPVLRSGGFVSQDYDPAVYYSAAVGLFSGLMPYRDFLLLHPPGILIALQPLAAVGAIAGDPIGMATARVSFMLIGSASTVLIYRILLPQHRYAALVGAGVYAVWFPAIYSEQSVKLEGLATCLMLIGVLAVRSTARTSWWIRPAVAGAMFGLATTVKIWGVTPMLALVIWLCWRHGLRQGLTAIAGATAAVAAVLLPFAGALPQMWNMVVVDQIDRTRSLQSLAARFADTLGLGLLPRPLAVGPLLLFGAATVVALWLAWRTRFGRLYALLTIATILTLIAGPTWFPHYAAFAAAPLCLVFGTAAAEVLGILSTKARRKRTFAGALVALCALGAVMNLQPEATSFDGSFLATVLAHTPGCVTTDNPATLIFSNTLRRNLRSQCPLVVDLGGYGYDFSRKDARRTDRAQNPDFQRFAMNYLGSGGSAVLIRFGSGDLSKKSRTAIKNWPILDRSGSLTVRQPYR